MTSTNATTSDTLPAERITPGTGFQAVNIMNPNTGAFHRQVRYHGTVEQARAYGLLGFYHPTQERWHELRAIIVNA